jgi:hypothetical protein
MNGVEGQPDVAGQDLNMWQKLFNRSLSNIPGISETLPEK